MRRRELLGLAATLSTARVLAWSAPAAAQALAGKQIRLIVPFPPGGATDIVARPFSQMLGEALKATVVVDNRGGAGGSIAAETVAKSAPNGQTLFIGTVGTHAINPSLYTKLPYDPVRDFTPLARIAMAPVAVVVRSDGPAKNLGELVALAKAKPGTLNYGSAGIGTPGHLTAEMFKSVAGIDIAHVPYKGGAPAITDLIGGQIQILFDPLQSVLSHVQAGNLRALAVSGKLRSQVLPDVPTIAESGYDGFETTAWWGIFAPAKLPDALTTVLIAEIERIAGSDAFREGLAPLGVMATAGPGGVAFAEFQHSEIRKWGHAVHDANVKLD